MNPTMPQPRPLIPAACKRRLPLRAIAAGCTLLCILFMAALPGCHAATNLGQSKMEMALSSASFVDGAIPKKFTCDGADLSPSLAWAAPPAATQSLALTVTDPDAPLGSFVHWVLYDLPASRRELAEGLPKQDPLPDGTRQGQNEFDKTGYGGPCPPGTSTHHYVFALYAVDTRLNLPAGTTRKQLEDALKDHVLAHGELIGTYHR
jgi:Raf kinase inhibitor-like YbhB/YbcL family protein